MDEPLLILYHKQATSARTRFLRFGHGVLAFAPAPAAAVLREADAPRPAVLPHPAPGVQRAEQRLGLAAGALRADGEFYAELETPQGSLPVLLAEFTAIDPPFAAAEAQGGRFIAITEARGLPPVDLALLRRAYEHVLG